MRWRSGSAPSRPSSKGFEKFTEAFQKLQNLFRQEFRRLNDLLAIRAGPETPKRAAIVACGLRAGITAAEEYRTPYVW